MTMVFPVVIYGCESWTVKKAERQRIDAFEVWCWRLLRVHWTARRSNQHILKENSVLGVHWKDWCWSWNSNTLATWCQELTHWKRPWFWERLRAGGEGDDRGWDGWMASLTRWTWVWVNCRSWWWTGRPGVLRFMGSQRVRHDWATEVRHWKMDAQACPSGSDGNRDAMQETQVQSLGWEDPLEKEMATHFSIPAWRIPWTEEPGGLQFMGSPRAGHDWVTNICMLKSFI